MNRIIKLLAAAVVGLTGLTGAVSAQDYPSRTITWIAPFGAGGGADRWSRTMSSVAFDVMDQAMRVRNIPGASATVGWGELLKQPADGHTVMLSSPTPIIALVTEPNAPFEPDEVKIVAFISAFRGIILVKPNTEWSDWDSFVAFARANPGQITLGSTFSEMVGAQLAFSSEGIDINLIPYDSTSDSVTDFLGGHIDAIGVTESTALNMVPEEALALINVTTLPLSDDVAEKLGNPPHAADLGYDTINFPRWVGVHPDTPDEIVEQLSAHVGTILEQESVQTITGKMGEEIIFVPWQDAQPQYESLVAGIRSAAPAITGN